MRMISCLKACHGYWKLQSSTCFLILQENYLSADKGEAIQSLKILQSHVLLKAR